MTAAGNQGIWNQNLLFIAFNLEIYERKQPGGPYSIGKNEQTLSRVWYKLSVALVVT
jgi:hypothetical protein